MSRSGFTHVTLESVARIEFCSKTSFLQGNRHYVMIRTGYFHSEFNHGEENEPSVLKCLAKIQKYNR